MIRLGTSRIYFRHAGLDPASRRFKGWIPAFAGMTLWASLNIAVNNIHHCSFQKTHSLLLSPITRAVQFSYGHFQDQEQ